MFPLQVTAAAAAQIILQASRNVLSVIQSERAGEHRLQREKSLSLISQM